MMSVQATERATYEGIWSIPKYGDHSPGEKLAAMFLGMESTRSCRAFGARTVLDAGCGSGKGAIALAAAGLDVDMCDLTDAGLVDEARRFRFSPACLWKPLRPQVKHVAHQAWDFVYCCDVLEHVPPEFTMLVIARLLEVTRHLLFLNISTQPDAFGAWVGKALHQSVYPFAWWRAHLAEIGHVVEARDLIGSGVYLVEPR